MVANRPERRSGLCYDLHSHSTCSDGLLSPAGLVRRAAANGVDVLALTDHDSTAGLEEAHIAAHEAGITLINGVEISVSWGDQPIHIVALGVDPGCPALAAGLARQRAIREERAIRIAERLDRLGLTGSLAGAAAHAGEAPPGRSHFARFLVEHGHARDLQRAFKRYLGRSGAAYVPCRWAALEEVLPWIQAAGGRAVVAHPVRYRMTRRRLLRFLDAFGAVGGDAIEVISGRQNADQTRAVADLARSFALYASVGSDFHAPGAGWSELGRIIPLPAGCVPVWADW